MLNVLLCLYFDQKYVKTALKEWGIHIDRYGIIFSSLPQIECETAVTQHGIFE